MTIDLLTRGNLHREREQLDVLAAAVAELRKALIDVETQHDYGQQDAVDRATERLRDARHGLRVALGMIGPGRAR